MVGNLSLEARNTIQAIKACDVEKRVAGLRGLRGGRRPAGALVGGPGEGALLRWVTVLGGSRWRHKESKIQEVLGRGGWTVRPP